MLQNTNTLYKYYLLGRCELHAPAPNRDDAPAELIAAWALGVYEQGNHGSQPKSLRDKASLVREVGSMMGKSTP